MMQEHKGLMKIWGLFAFFLLCFVLNLAFSFGIDRDNLMLLLTSFFVVLLSLVMLVKNGMPHISQIVIAVIFGTLMFVAYSGIVFSTIKFIVVVLAVMASYSIFNQYKDNALKLIKDTSLQSISKSICIGLICGIILGVINLFLMGGTMRFNFTLQALLLPLSPAIYEEIAFRTFFFAVCLYFLKGQINTKPANFTCWFMMIIPHVLLHFPNAILAPDFLSNIVNLILLNIPFGIALAFLQRKRDITTAMITHGAIDLLRFLLLGI